MKTHYLTTDKKGKIVKVTRLSNKTRRAMLLQEVCSLESEIEHAEMRIPEALKKLKALKPTKKEMAEENLQELFDTYLIKS